MSNHTSRLNMIKQQLRTGDVLRPEILDLFTTIPREAFVPDDYVQFAYSDMQIPLKHQQIMMTPTEEGLLLQALNLTGKETVLEIGTGTGFLTALLSKLSKKVISIDYFSDFTAGAATKLAAHECNNVELITGDASLGWLDKAPYDVIVYTAALESLTESHFLQILPGGKLFAIIGKGYCMHAQLYTLNHEDVWQQSLVFETRVPELIDKLKPKEFIF